MTSLVTEIGYVLGKRGRYINTWVKKHDRKIRLYHLDKSAMADHSFNLRRCIQVHDTSITST
jgi:hypothetical protein